MALELLKVEKSVDSDKSEDEKMMIAYPHYSYYFFIWG
jgi:hypothetical protein